MGIASAVTRAGRKAARAADGKKPERTRARADDEYTKKVRERVGEVDVAAGRVNARTGGPDRFAYQQEYGRGGKEKITEGKRSFARMQEAASEGSRSRAKKVVELERKVREGDTAAEKALARLDKKSAEDLARSTRRSALTSSVKARAAKGKLKDSDMLVGNTTNGITKDGEIIGNPTPNQIAQAMKVRRTRR